jgi:hypothetical protein
MSHEMSRIFDGGCVATEMGCVCTGTHVKVVASLLLLFLLLVHSSLIHGADSSRRLCCGYECIPGHTHPKSFSLSN